MSRATFEKVKMFGRKSILILSALILVVQGKTKRKKNGVIFFFHHDPRDEIVGHVIIYVYALCIETIACPLFLM